MRWIKLTQRRAAGQHMAHLITHLSLVNAAYQVICNGMVIVGKKVWARQMCREPRRCLKCQCLNTNHLAAKCMHRETCGTCGGEHRMVECAEADHERFQCVNCNMAGHTLWD